MFIPAARRQTVPVTYLTKKCVCVNCCCCRCCCVHDFSEVKWTKKKYFHRAVDPFFFFSSCLGYFSHAIVCGNERTNEIKIESWPFFPSPPRVLREKIFFFFFLFFFLQNCRHLPTVSAPPAGALPARLYWMGGHFLGWWRVWVLGGWGWLYIFPFYLIPTRWLARNCHDFFGILTLSFFLWTTLYTHTSLVRYPVPYLSWGRAGWGEGVKLFCGSRVVNNKRGGDHRPWHAITVISVCYLTTPKRDRGRLWYIESR